MQGARRMKNRHGKQRVQGPEVASLIPLPIKLVCVDGFSKPCAECGDSLAHKLEVPTLLELP